MILERDVESRLVSRAAALHGACVKFIPDNKRGMPDRIVMLPGGVLVWVETKKPKGGALSAVQKHRHKQLGALGQRVCVCWTIEQVDKLMDALAHESERVTSRACTGDTDTGAHTHTSEK
ncbi:MAG: VRR-NUC domain-containing protein [Oscillospiraceae bacterium]